MEKYEIKNFSEEELKWVKEEMDRYVAEEWPLEFQQCYILGLQQYHTSELQLKSLMENTSFIGGTSSCGDASFIDNTSSCGNASFVGNMSRYGNACSNGITSSYDNNREHRHWLLWLRGDVERIYKHGFKISKDFPVIPLIPKYKAEGIQIPSDINVQNKKQKYNFYEVRVYFHIVAEENILLKNINLKLKFKDDFKDSHRRTVATSMIPDNTYRNILKSNTKAQVAITADGRAKSEIPSALLNLNGIGGGASIVGSIKSSIDLTLPAININKTIISAAGLYNTECSWEFEEVKPREDVQVLVILKVPQEVSDLKLKASLEVTPYKNEWKPLSPTRLKSIKTYSERKIDLRT